MLKVNRTKKLQKKTDDSFWLKPIGFIAVCSAITAVWVCYIGVLRMMYPNLSERGVSGDAFGGLTALFSGLAFAGLIFTLLVQKKELELQRRELARLVEEQSKTSEHLKAQNKQLEIQSDFVGHQIFEANFFRLVGLITDQIEGASHQKTGVRLVGRAAIRRIWYEIQQDVLSRVLKRNADGIDDAFGDAYQKYKDDISPMVKLCDNALIYLEKYSKIGPKFYLDVIFSIYGNSEITILMMYAAHKNRLDGNSNFANRLKKFGFVDKIDMSLDPKILDEIFDGLGISEEIDDVGQFELNDA